MLKLSFLANRLRLWKVRLKLTFQSAGIVAEHDCADALVGGRDKNQTERAFPDGKANRFTLTPGAKRCVVHLQYLQKN
jgi:hypothetical protein